MRMTCGKPFPGTIGAETHCECYFDDSDEAGPCCWCGSEEDEGDYPSCPAVAVTAPLGVKCPNCGASPGVRCHPTVPGTLPYGTSHQVRHQAAEELAKGTETTDG